MSDRPPKPLILIRSSLLVLPLVVASLTGCMVAFRNGDALLQVLAVASNAAAMSLVFLARRRYTVMGLRMKSEQRRQLHAAGYVPRKCQMVKRKPPFPVWVEVQGSAE